MIHDFIVDAEQLIAELAAPARASDALAFRDRAHALRSSAAHIGATALFELCLGWRGIGAAELAERRAPACIARLEAEFERLRDALLAELAAQRSPNPMSRRPSAGRTERASAPPRASGPAPGAAAGPPPRRSIRRRSASSRASAVATQRSVTSISSS